VRTGYYALLHDGVTALRTDYYARLHDGVTACVLRNALRTDTAYRNRMPPFRAPHIKA
jgi:hypothetical protein